MSTESLQAIPPLHDPHQRAAALAVPEPPSTTQEAALVMYLHLRRTGPAPLETLREELGLTKHQATLSWRHLNEMALLQQTGAHGAFSAVDPEAALLLLFERQKARMEAHSVELEHLQRSAQTIAHRLRPAVLRETSSVEVQYLHDRHHRTECLTSLNATAQFDTWSMHPGPLPAWDVLAASLELDAALIQRGVRVRAVYGHAVASSTRARRYLEQLADLGAEVRLCRQVPFDLLLFDSHTAVIPSNPGRLSEPMLLLHGSQLMATYLATYDDVWVRSVPFSADSAEPAEDQLSDKQHAVLILMTNGLTDEQIGRRLGISPRTVGRITAEVMAIIGGSSRFQSGVLAALKGLVGVDAA